MPGKPTKNRVLGADYMTSAPAPAKTAPSTKAAAKGSSGDTAKKAAGAVLVAWGLWKLFGG